MKNAAHLRIQYVYNHYTCTDLLLFRIKCIKPQQNSHHISLLNIKYRRKHDETYYGNHPNCTSIYLINQTHSTTFNI